MMTLRMVRDFRDGPRGRSAHDRFQRWRSEHPAGFLLNLETRTKAMVHATACRHLGDPSLTQEDLGESLTRKAKICAETVRELNEWALKESVKLTQCSDCARTGATVNEERPSTTRRRLVGGDAEAQELAANVERLLPARRTRTALLGCLARSILAAARTSPAGWGVTANKDYVRLNAGMVEMFTVYEGGARIITMNYRSQRPPRRCSLASVAFTHLHGRQAAVTGPHDAIVAAFEDIWGAHELAITTAGARRGYSWPKSHREGMLRYIEHETGINLPNPSWSDRAASVAAPTPEDWEGVRATEGARRLVEHFKIEREPALVAKAKKKWLLEDPRLACHDCGFSFVEVCGRPYIEAHHRNPLGLTPRDATVTTTIADLVPLCPNCHRLAHLIVDS